MIESAELSDTCLCACDTNKNKVYTCLHVRICFLVTRHVSIPVAITSAVLYSVVHAIYPAPANDSRQLCEACSNHTGCNGYLVFLYMPSKRLHLLLSKVLDHICSVFS